jgi:hypothetical protein
MGGFLATVLVGSVLSIPNGQFPVVAQPNTLYSTTQAIATVPFGARCELYSTMVNGQIVQGQLCR